MPDSVTESPAGTYRVSYTQARVVGVFVSDPHLKTAYALCSWERQ